MKPARTRSKACEVCGQEQSVLYRVQVSLPTWLFACAECRKGLEAAHPVTYRYGGTWKANKRH
jgi:hypothetical protein